MLMKACKSTGGLTGGKLRNQKSAHKVWTLTLNHFSSINQSFIEIEKAKKEHPGKGVIHTDLSNAAMKKDYTSFNRALDWFNDNISFDQDSDVLLSFSTGLIGKADTNEVNPEKSETVGSTIQASLDGLSFVDKISIKMKVKNLSSLKKPVKVNNKNIIIDSLKLFNRLILIS